MIIGITGGKGGTGKSTIATALAFELAKRHKVLLVDADVDCPDDHLLLGIGRTEVKKVMQRIPRWDMKRCTGCGKCAQACRMNAIVSVRGKKPIFTQEQCNGCGACRIVCPEDAISWDEKEIGRIYRGRKHGIDLLSGELKTNQPVSEFVVNSLNEMIKEESHEYIIIDTAAGTHCPVIAAIEVCDRIYAVTEPTPLGSHDLELILKIIKDIGKAAGIIINRSDIGDRRLIECISKRYGAGIIAEIPYSEGIVKKYSEGIPIEETCIKDIAAEVTG